MEVRKEGRMRKRKKERYIERKKGRKEEKKKKFEKNTIECIEIDWNFWHPEDEARLKIKSDN